MVAIKVTTRAAVADTTVATTKETNGMEIRVVVDTKDTAVETVSSTKADAATTVTVAAAVALEAKVAVAAVEEVAAALATHHTSLGISRIPAVQSV